jgi:hypothetical protein
MQSNASCERQHTLGVGHSTAGTTAPFSKHVTARLFARRARVAGVAVAVPTEGDAR